MEGDSQHIMELREQNELLRKQLEELRKQVDGIQGVQSDRHEGGAQANGMGDGGRSGSQGGSRSLLNNIGDDLELFRYFKLEIPRPIKLTTSNFDDWYSQLLALMELYGLGHVLEPLESTHPDYKEISDAQSKVVKLYIRNSLEGEDRYLVNECRTARDIIETLYADHFGSGEVRRPALLHALWNTRMEDNESASSFIERIRKIRRELIWLKHPVHTYDLNVVIVKAISNRSEFDSCREHIISNAKTLSLNEVKHQLELKENLQKLDNLSLSSPSTKSKDDVVMTGTALHTYGGPRGNNGGGYNNRVANFHSGGGSGYQRGFNDGGNRGGHTRGRGRGSPYRPRGGIHKHASAEQRENNNSQRGARVGGRARGSSRRYVKCRNCGGIGHFMDECKKPCQSCGDYKHKTPFCRTRGTPTGKASLAMGNEDPMEVDNPQVEERGGAYMTRGDENIAEEGKLSSKHEWILDGGATHHMTPCRDLLFNYRKCHGIVDVAANGVSIKREGIGSMRVLTTIDGNVKKLVIHDVWYVPDLSNGLLSMPLLIAKKYWPRFDKRTCGITLCNMDDVPYIHCIHMNNLHWPDWYVALNPESEENGQGKYYSSLPKGVAKVARAIRSDCKKSAHLWHIRLGHINYDTLAHLVQHNLINGVDVSHKDILAAKRDSPCETCIMAKYDRAPFGTSDKRATRPLEVIHSDLCEYDVTSLGDARWALTVLDDYSDFCAIMPLKRKNEVQFHLPRILNEWQNLIQQKVKMLFTDRGGEYIDSAIQKYCADRGIIHEKSPPRVHELNGRAENLNKRLNNRLRAMLYTYLNVPKIVQLKLWAEGIMYLSHLHNVSLVRRLNMTPMQAFKGVVPNVAYLRAFGCKVFYRVSDEVRTKLQSKARPAIYMGPSYDGPGVRVLTYHPDLKQRQWQVRIVRDVFAMESLTRNGDVQQNFELQQSAPIPGVLQESGKIPLGAGQESQACSDWPSLQVTPSPNVPLLEYRKSVPSRQKGTIGLDSGTPGISNTSERAHPSSSSLRERGPRANDTVREHNATAEIAPGSLRERNAAVDTTLGAPREHTAAVDTTPSGIRDANPNGNVDHNGQIVSGNVDTSNAFYERISSSYSSQPSNVSQETQPSTIQPLHVDDTLPPPPPVPSGNAESPQPPNPSPQQEANDTRHPSSVGRHCNEEVEELQLSRYPKRQRTQVERFDQNPKYMSARRGTWSELFSEVGKASVAIPHRSILQEEEDNCMEKFYELRDNMWICEDLYKSEVSIAFAAKARGRDDSSKPSLLHHIHRNVENGQNGKPVTQWDKVDPDRDTPKTYLQALNGKYRDEWVEALVDEYKSLLENATWHLVPRLDVPQDKKVIPSKWVFKIKVDADGFPVRFKCRLVAGGHKQVYGEDYDLTYAPVSRITTLRVLLSVAAYRGWKVHQLDIKTAFLHGDVDTDVYMEQPEGFTDDPNMVCKLDKCLYGLKQAPRAWYIKLTQFLTELGFVVSELDSSLWIKETKHERLYLAMVVDDIAITGASEHQILLTIKHILLRFPGTHAGEIKWYVGMKITWLPAEHAVVLSQTAHIDNILKKFEGKGNTLYPRYLPMKEGLQLYNTGSSDKPVSPILDTIQFPYRSLVGALNYLACSTRPDIAYTVNKLSKFLNEPRVEHWDVAISLLRYLKATKHMGLKLGGGKEGALCFCDASYGSFVDPATGDACVRATTSSVFLVNGGAVHWKSGTQEYASRSTTDAEYKACCDATCDAIWLMELLRDFEVDSRPFLIKNDSQGAVCAICNQNITQRTKHIARQVGFVRDNYKRGMVTFEHIPGSENIADVLTKALGGTKHKKFTTAMGMSNIK